MPLLIAVFVVVVAGSIAAGVLAHRQGWSLGGGPTTWGRAAAARLGIVPGAALPLIAGVAVTAGVGLALGFAAKHLQSSIDEPVFRWIHPRVRAGAVFSKANEKLTLLGNTTTVQLVVLVSVIVLAFVYRRRWWLPVIAIPASLYIEKYLQKFLGKVVDRGHPPTTLGTYPSGGVGRILAVYGTVIVLVIVAMPALSRAWRAGLWTGLVTAAVAEAFTRAYLSKHWLTDAVFALVFGTLLLLTNVATISAVTSGGRELGGDLGGDRLGRDLVGHRLGDREDLGG